MAVFVLLVASAAWVPATRPPIRPPPLHRPQLVTTTMIQPLDSTSLVVAASSSASVVPAALVAYGHYLGLLLTVASLTVERVTIKPAMSIAEEQRMAVADSVYGVAGLLVVTTGYFRVTQFGKGWEFYAHEPIFWLKLTLVAVAGSASFFPTIKIIQRSVAQRQAGDSQIEPMSEKLAARMTSIINAEILAIGAIPLSATLMARGVGYQDWMPWQAGAAPAILALGGLGFKYVNEALTWAEG